MPFLSIIIPVYNVEQYLEKCVHSILAQDYDNYEILLVNDGSSDGSPALCDSFATEHANIKVIHKENGGSSSARNAGIRAAEGSYLMFVDSDDYWEKGFFLEAIEQKVHDIPNLDVLMFGSVVLNTYTGKRTFRRAFTDPDIRFIETQTKEALIIYLFDNNLNPTSAWSLVVRRNLIIGEEIYFETGLIAEDIDWSINLFQKAFKFSAITDIFYVYLKNRTDSVSNTSGVKGVESILFILDRWVPVFEGRDDQLSRRYVEYLAFHYAAVFLTFAYLPATAKNILAPKLRKYTYLLEKVKTKKGTLVKWLIRFFGINTGSVILRIIYKRIYQQY